MENLLNKNNILKGAGVLLIAAVMILSTVSATANTEETRVAGPYIKTDIKTAASNNNPMIGKGVFEDSFENYEDFIVDDFPPWTTYDGDGGQTWGVDGVTWPNTNYIGSFMIFNPSQTTPPFVDHPPHSGEKYASCWDAVTASAPNDDWLFTPQLHLEEAGMLSFWGRSLNDAYGLEEIEYGISTTDTDPSSFTIVSGPVINVPTDWTEYTYDLSNYAGSDIYIGIHVVSNDHFAFFLDDFSVTGVAMSEPNLDCDGELTWTDVEPGETVTGSFTVENIGEPESMLNWEVESYPTDWGNWTFTPSSGSGLTPEDPAVTVDVEVVAPEEQEQTFTGEVKIVNLEDPDDFCIIDVSLATPVSQESDGLFGWVFLRGLVFNPREDGSRINARAINLHYVEITPQGLRRGVVRLKTVSFRNGVFIKMSEKGLLGNAVRVSGFCHGAIELQ